MDFDNKNLRLGHHVQSELVTLLHRPQILGWLRVNPAGKIPKIPWVCLANGLRFFSAKSREDFLIGEKTMGLGATAFTTGQKNKGMSTQLVERG